MTLALFDLCPLPGCRCVVPDGRRPCECCLTAFGHRLRETSIPAPPRAEFVAGQAAGIEQVKAIQAARRNPQHFRNQRCWLCEERRTCIADPAHPDRMICLTCEKTEA